MTAAPKRPVVIPPRTLRENLGGAHGLPLSVAEDQCRRSMTPPCVADFGRTLGGGEGQPGVEAGVGGRGSTTLGVIQ